MSRKSCACALLLHRQPDSSLRWMLPEVCRAPRCSPALQASASREVIHWHCVTCDNWGTSVRSLTSLRRCWDVIAHRRGTVPLPHLPPHLLFLTIQTAAVYVIEREPGWQKANLKLCLIIHYLYHPLSVTGGNTFKGDLYVCVKGLQHSKSPCT